MTPPNATLSASLVCGWRLDESRWAQMWDSGEGAYRVGGRWNSKGTRCVYCSLDASTAILEIAVHKGFRALDIVPHTLTKISIANASLVHVVDAATLPNPNWLVPSVPSAGQQAFGDGLLKSHRFVALPSAVARHCWNLIFDPTKAAGFYTAVQETFALDPRLHPSTAPSAK